MQRSLKTTLLSTSLLLACITSSYAVETTLGKAYAIDHMQVGGVYLQPVTMQPSVPTAFKGYPDAHLELDIHATKGNPNGFALGEWIPYLEVTYHLTKLQPKSNPQWQQTGWLMPMMANDGPHYGRNVKFDGPGKYAVTFHIDPPNWDGMFRHTDKETGVAPWFKPFDVSWTFTYLGTGKKGGY